LKTDAEGINISDLNARSYPIVEEETEVINDVYAELYVSPNGDDSGDGSAVAPFATIQRAVDEVPKLRGGMTGDIVINIAGGDYKIAEPISLTEENGGRDGYNVIFRGDPGNKPVINGGTQVSGWTKYDEKVWSAPLDVKEDIRQLYINDVEATRARSKYRYFAAENYTIENSVVSQGIKVNSRNFPCRFEHSEDMELVWDLEWKCNYTGVSEILYDTDNGETNTIVMDQPSWGKFANNAEDAKNVGWGARFYFSNAKELLDEPGEFYYDKHEKVIYYYPYSYEDLTNAACYVGTTELMLQACGANLENKLDGLRMENLQFKYGAWNEPSEIGVVVRQGTTVKDPKATGLDWYEMPGQLDFKSCKNIKITNCNFNCLGSTAITMNEDVTYAQISGNIFTDISGGGVSIDEQSHNNNLDLTKYGRSTDITISNNIFRRIGTDYRSSCAIMGYYTKNFKVLHNDIRDIPYTGISAGWGWQDNMLTGIMTDIEIAYNYIEDTNTPTHDGAQIYTLAEQANTSIHDNYLQKSGDHRGGIYLDEGSTNMKVYNNVVKDAYYWLCARPNVSIKNVVATNNYSDTSTMWIDTAHVELTDTTVVTDGNWPDEALYIMENSGLEAEYRHLYDETPDFPENRTQIKDIPIYEYVTTDQTYVRAVDFLPGWGVGYYRSVGRGTEASRISYREAKIRDQEILNDIWINTSNWHDFSIGDVEEDDFWCYTYHCKQEGDYDFWMEYKNGFPLSQPHAKVTVLVDGVEVISRALLESTGDGDWSQPPVTTSFGKVHLTEGSHHVKIMTVDNGWSFLGWGFSDGDMKVPFGNDIEYDELGYVDEKQPEKIVEFTDIAGHWAENDIRAMQKAGIINGMTDTLFAPNTPLTLYQTAWLALRSLGIPYTEETWKALAVQNGLLTDENELDAPITRERLAYNIMNAYTNIVGSYSITVGAALYTDMDEISPAYEQAVRGANSQGLLKGDLSGTFRPKSELTRAEGAAAFHRLYSLFH